jgi:hypothetical protein
VTGLTLSAEALDVRERPANRWHVTWNTANVVALLVVAIGLRTWHLGNVPGINGDEAWSGVQALRLLHGQEIEWRTPNGNPINPFYFIPLLVLHATSAPSFVLLRLVALASGLAALVANYMLCRRAFDLRTAMISTVILALLPIDIAYSRFGWDASQSLLATLLVLYLPLIHLSGRGESANVPTAGVLALAAAVLVHPTNVFAAVLLVAPALYVRRGQIMRTLRHTTASASCWWLVGLVFISLVVGYAGWQLVAHGSQRPDGIGELPAFAKNYLQLLSGTTVYEFIGGLSTQAPESFPHFALACDLALAGLGCCALWGLASRLRARPTDSDMALAIGWLGMLLGFFVIAGPGALEPHRERYGICLIGPASLVLARGLAWWLEGFQPHRRSAAIALSIAAWLAPVSFYCGYFEFGRRGIGEPHRAFRSADIEPKLQALQRILASGPAGQKRTVVCHDWWSYWPLAYLAAGKDGLSVISWDEWQKTTAPAGDATWFVEFAGTAEERQLLEWLKRTMANASRQTICDFAGKPVLHVMGPVEQSRQR